MRHLASRRSLGSDCLSELRSRRPIRVMCPWQSVVRAVICSEELMSRYTTESVTAAPGKHTQMGGISPHSVHRPRYGSLPVRPHSRGDLVPHDSAIRGRTPSGGTSHELYPGVA